jgi:hypothetical protein
MKLIWTTIKQTYPQKKGIKNVLPRQPPPCIDGFLILHNEILCH